jgi:hypothetical protein
VIVRYLYIVGIVIAPNEANPVLIVDANTVLSLPVAAQFLEPVTGWTLQIMQFHGHIEHSQLSSGYIGRGRASGLAGPPYFR